MTRRQHQILWTIVAIALAIFSAITAWGLGAIVAAFSIGALWCREVGQWLVR